MGENSRKVQNDSFGLNIWRNLNMSRATLRRGVLITEGTRLEDSVCTQNDTLIPTP